MTVALSSENEFRELVRELEACTLAPARFHHAEHLIVMAVYIHDLGYEAGLERMRETIQRYAAHLVVTGKYHETLTVFWARMVAGVVSAGSGDLATRVPRMLESLGDKALAEQYFSRQLLDSEAARSAWVEPDLRPLAPLQHL